jgi:hypothetical protein
MDAMEAGRGPEEGPFAGRVARRSGGLLPRVIDLFLHEAPPRLEAAWDAGRSGDFRAVAVAAHTIGCLAGNVGAEGVRGLALDLEAAAESGGRRVRRVSALLYDLEIAHFEARIHLAEVRRTLRP